MSTTENKVQDLGIVSAIVNRATSKVNTKSNGGSSRTCVATITEKGHMFEGKAIFGQRTLVNRDGEDKAEVTADEEVRVQVSYIAPEDSNSGKAKFFFEIYKLDEGNSIEVTSEDELAKAMDIASQKA